MKKFLTKRDMCDYVMNNCLEIYDSKGNEYFVQNIYTEKKQTFLIPKKYINEELMES